MLQCGTTLLHRKDAQGGADAKGCAAMRAAVMHHPGASICITHVFPCGFQNVNLRGSFNLVVRLKKLTDRM